MEGVQELLRGIQETLNQHGKLLKSDNKKINSINQRVKNIEHQIYAFQDATSTALDYVQEDCQNILDNTVDLQSKAKRSSRLIKNLGSGLKLPMDYVSDSDNSFVRRSNPGHYGNRRSKPMRRTPEHQVIQKPFSTPGSDSDSENDFEINPRVVNGPLIGDHHLLPSGHNDQTRGESYDQSRGESRVTEEVPTTVPPMHDMEGDIKALQSAGHSIHQPGDRPAPTPGQPANLSGQTIPTSSTSGLLMSATSSTRCKDLSSSLSSNSSTNQNEILASQISSESNIPSQTRLPVLPSGGDKSANSMFLENRPNIDAPPRTQPVGSSSTPTPPKPTTTTTYQNIPRMQQTLDTDQTSPTTAQTTPTTIQTTPTAVHTTTTTQQATSSMPNIPSTTQQMTVTSSQASSWTVEMGMGLQPDFSSVERVIESLGLPLNDNTKGAISSAFTSDGEPSMERPKGLYTVLLVDTSYSTSSTPVKDIIKSFIDDFMDEIEDSAANETLEENVALVTFGWNTGVQQGFTNDFSLIRDAFDSLPYKGRSPLATGLAVCLTYMEKSSKQLQQSGMEIFPRLVILTDGHATDDVDFGSNNDEPDPSAVTVKSRIIQIVQTFSARNYPLSCGAVNKQYSDEVMIDDIAAIGGGTKIDLFQQPHGQRQAKILGRYYFYQTIVAQVKHDLEESGGMGDASKILMDAISNKTLNQEDMEELIDMLGKNEIEAKFDDRLPSVRTSDESDDETLQIYDFQELAHMPTIGSRVKKGPQWKQGEPDPRGLGTVVAHASEGMVVVKWDKGKIDRYQYLSDYQEVTLTGGPSQPRQVRSGQDVDVGCWVKRGPQWNKGDEDGQAAHGVVIRRHKNMSVTVKWPIGIVERYKCGQDGIVEVEAITHVPIAESQPQTDSQQLPAGRTDARAAGAVTREDGLVSCWQFQDGLNQWRTFSMDESAKLDNHSTNRKSGLITVTHKGTQYRIDLPTMRYREQGAQAQGPIQQTYVTPEEYQTMMVIEDIGAM
ncbi:uncharacterized protein LOC110454986 isoform X2 [Mizuhopecten yessoensis]|uniref:Uncharacterized protein n=1 Tax=Mizuhopecten yessoensis TaxID=6573 RepID=A0A210QDT8_MIZYE|nr:uncharacterized protein LOC110454986 isoform X2 [Mizuhopecten yessoensis]OWF46886.1 hypothetical protein KP79_PYT14974 [Mizuhopecten yessoensis]